MNEITKRTVELDELIEILEYLPFDLYDFKIRRRPADTVMNFQTSKTVYDIEYEEIED